MESRLVSVENENTKGIKGLCLDVHDLVLSKYAAGHEKDIKFAKLCIEYKSYLNTNVANMMPWLENIKREGLQDSFEGRQRSRC